MLGDLSMNQNQIVFNQGIFETVEQLEKKGSLKVGSHYDFATKSLKTLNTLFKHSGLQPLWPLNRKLCVE